MRMAEKSLLLQILDQLWKEHLLQLDHLRQGIHLRAYGQRDPLNEYKREAFELFEGMLANLRQTVTQVLATSRCARSRSRLRRPKVRRWRSWRRPGRMARARPRPPRPVPPPRPALAAATDGARRQPRGELGQGAAQRALPLRVGQEVQALPRPAPLSRRG